MREARQHDNSDIKNKDNKHLICICDEKKKTAHPRHIQVALSLLEASCSCVRINLCVQERPELEGKHNKYSIISIKSLLKEMSSEHALGAPLTNELLNILKMCI